MGCPQEDSRRNTAWDVRQERSNDNRRTAGKHRRGCPQDIDFFVTVYIVAKRRCARVMAISQPDVRQDIDLLYSLAIEIGKSVSCRTPSLILWHIPPTHSLRSVSGVTKKTMSYGHSCEK